MEACRLQAAGLNALLVSCGANTAPGTGIGCMAWGPGWYALHEPEACDTVAAILGHLQNNAGFGARQSLRCTPTGLIIAYSNCPAASAHLDAAVTIHRSGLSQSCAADAEAAVPGFTRLVEDGSTGACSFRGPNHGRHASQVATIAECGALCAATSVGGGGAKCIGFDAVRSPAGDVGCSTYWTPGSVVGVTASNTHGCFVRDRPTNSACLDVPVGGTGVLACPVGKYISMIKFAAASGSEGSCFTGFSPAGGAQCDIRSWISTACLGRTSCGLSTTDLQLMAMACLIDRPLPPTAGPFAAGNVTATAFGRLQVEGACSEHNVNAYTRTSTTVPTTTTTTTKILECVSAPSCQNSCASSTAMAICEPLAQYWDNQVYHRTHEYRATCYCDNSCEHYHDCCLDYSDHCPFTTVDTTSEEPTTTVRLTRPGTATAAEPGTTATPPESAAPETTTEVLDAETTTTTEATNTSTSTSTAADETPVPATTEAATDGPSPARTCGRHFQCGSGRFCAAGTGENALGSCGDCYDCSDILSITPHCPAKCRGATATTTTTTGTTATTVTTVTAGFCSTGTASTPNSDGVVACCPSYCSSCTGPRQGDSQGCEENAVGVPLYPDGFECCMFAHLETFLEEEPRICETLSDVSCVIGDPCASITCATECDFNGCGWSSTNNRCRLGASTSDREKGFGNCSN